MKILASKDFIEIWMEAGGWGGGLFEVGNPEWRGGLAVLEIQEEGGA